MTAARIMGAGGLFDMDETSAIMTQLCTVMQTVGDTDEAEFEKALPDDTWRRFILDAIERLSPALNTGVELEVARKDKVLMNTERARPFVERLIRAPTRQRSRGVVVGEFKRIDFMKREITVRHLATSRDLTCIYQEYVEDSLLEHPRDTLLVFGTVTRDAQNDPVSIDDVERIEAVTLAPVRISKVLVGNFIIEPIDELSATVAFDEAESLFNAEVSSLGVQVYAETRELLEEALQEEMEILWKRYAQEKDSKLTPAAQALKQRVLSAFRTVTHAS